MDGLVIVFVRHLKVVFPCHLPAISHPLANDVSLS